MDWTTANDLLNALLGGIVKGAAVGYLVARFLEWWHVERVRK